MLQTVVKMCMLPVSLNHSSVPVSLGSVGEPHLQHGRWVCLKISTDSSSELWHHFNLHGKEVHNNKVRTLSVQK